jgi:hypothetical protein
VVWGWWAWCCWVVVTFGRLRGTAVACFCGMRAAVIEGRGQLCLVVWLGPWLLSAGRGWERFEALERCLELCDPGPRGLQELGAPS